ncbi:MAG: peptidoglycan-binding domain-containing protein [Alphaproteobacteria bacterium]
MQRLLKKRLVELMTVGAVIALLLPDASRADLDVAAACTPVGLADPVDRAAAAAALPTFSGVAQVCTVQALLATLGELPGSRTVDGRYDKQVRDALADFQRASGLDATGLLSPETLARLASDALDAIFADPGAPTATTTEPASGSETTAMAEDDFSSTQVPAPRPAADASAATDASTSTSANTSATTAVSTATDSTVVVTGSRLSTSMADSGDTASQTTSATGARAASSSSSSTASAAASTTSTVGSGTAAGDRVIVVDASDGDTDVNRVRVVVGGEVDANGNRIVSSEQTTVVTSTSIVETETYIVLADPLDDDSVSSFVRPSVCHDPTSVQDPDLIRNLDRLPDLVCLRVFEGAGDLPYRFYSLEALQSGPTLMVLHDGDDLAFDTAIRLLANHGGRLVVFEADEQSRTTLTGANLELMTVSPYSMQGCGWAASELQLAYALHDYVVAVDVAVVAVRSGATGLDSLDLFSNGSSRLDLLPGSAAREIFQPVSSTLAPGAFLEVMVTAATRRSQETRAIVQGALVNNLPTALTQVNLLSDADRCGLEMLAQQTDQPVARLLTGTTSTARALEVGAAMVRAMRLAQQSAGLDSGLSSDAAFDQLRAGQTATEAQAEAMARLSAPVAPAGVDAPVAPAGVDALAPVAVFGQGAGTTTAMVVGDASSYVDEMIGTAGGFPPAPKARLATSVRQILIPDGVDAAFIHDWIQPGANAAAPAATSVVTRTFSDSSGLTSAGTSSTAIY